MTGDLKFQSLDERRRELVRDIVLASWLPGPHVDPDGRQLAGYLDKFLFLTKPTVLRRLASILAESVPLGTDRIAGTEPGSVAIAVALSLETGLPYVSVDAHSLRSGPVLIQGELHDGERVAVVEDVVASGAHLVSVIAALEAGGAVVTAALVAVDRDDRGLADLEAAGHRLISVVDAASLARMTGGDRP